MRCLISRIENFFDKVYVAITHLHSIENERPIDGNNLQFDTQFLDNTINEYYNINTSVEAIEEPCLRYTLRRNGIGQIIF